MKRAEVGRVRDRDPAGEWYYDIFTGPADPDDSQLPLSKRDCFEAPIGGGRRHTHHEALTAALAEVGHTEKEQNR